MARVTIGNRAGDHISLDVVGRQSPYATHAYAANLLTVEVEVVVAPWRGAFTKSFLAQDFANLRGDLNRLHGAGGGEALFEQGVLQIRFEADALGHVRVSGQCRSAGVSPTQLLFELPTVDQTYLPAIIEQLGHLVQEFPVITD